MAIPSRSLPAEQINIILVQKRRQYDQMISDNKEFNEVKVLFSEIKNLERSMAELRQNDEPSFADPI